MKKWVYVRLSARWVSHVLTPEQKKNRVDCPMQPLAMFEPIGPKRVSDIVTGDESDLFL